MENNIYEFIVQNEKETIYIIKDEHGNIIEPTNLLFLNLVKKILECKKDELTTFYYEPTDNWYEYATYTGLVNGNQVTIEKLRDVTKYKKTEILLQKDGVTGLYNRRNLDEVINKYIGEASQAQEPFSVVFIDCDKFKEVNDIHGHDFGDLALKRVAEILKMNTRQNKGRRMDIVGRNGGDEFLMVMKDIDEYTTMTRLNEIQEQINTATICQNGQNIPICKLSIGYYTVESKETEPLLNDDLDGFRRKICRYGDQAMYYSKQQGGNQISSYQQTFNHIPTRIRKIDK